MRAIYFVCFCLCLFFPFISGEKLFILKSFLYLCMARPAGSDVVLDSAGENSDSPRQFSGSGSKAEQRLRVIYSFCHNNGCCLGFPNQVVFFVPPLPPVPPFHRCHLIHPLSMKDLRDLSLLDIFNFVNFLIVLCYFKGH